MKRHVALASCLLVAGLALSSTAAFATRTQPPPHIYPPGPSGMGQPSRSAQARKINSAPAPHRAQQAPNGRMYPPGPSAHEQPRPSGGSAG